MLQDTFTVPEALKVEVKQMKVLSVDPNVHGLAGCINCCFTFELTQQLEVIVAEPGITR